MPKRPCPHLAETVHPRGVIPGRPQGGHRNGYQYGNDGNDNQVFIQRKTLLSCRFLLCGRAKLVKPWHKHYILCMMRK